MSAFTCVGFQPHSSGHQDNKTLSPPLNHSIVVPQVVSIYGDVLVEACLDDVKTALEWRCRIASGLNISCVQVASIIQGDQMIAWHRDILDDIRPNVDEGVNLVAITSLSVLDECGLLFPERQDLIKILQEHFQKCRAQDIVYSVDPCMVQYTEGFGLTHHRQGLLPRMNLDKFTALKMLKIFLDVQLLEAYLSRSGCSRHSCPLMRAGNLAVYMWADDEDSPEPSRLSAPDYITMFFQLARKFLRDCPDDQDLVRTLAKRAFFIYAHGYIHHGEALMQGGHLGVSACMFRHLLAFARHYNFLSNDEMSPLREWIAYLDNSKY